MSSVVFGALTRKRQESGPKESVRDRPGLMTYADTLAALVPAEVLAAHAIILGSTTKTEKGTDGKTVTTITDPGTLKAAFWVLLVISILFYLAGFQKKKWSWEATVGMFIPPLAFIGWTAAQKATAFNAVWPSTSEASRDLIVIAGALVLGLVASLVPIVNDRAPAKGKPPRPN